MPYDTPSATGKLLADVSQTPAGRTLARRLEPGGVLPCPGVSLAARPFFAALLQYQFPNRTIVVVTENLKTQESFQQDLETWLGVSPFFFPAWETLPHEDKLPHADVISERLETLVALSSASASGPQISRPLVTNVTALLQKTFPPGDIRQRNRPLKRGDKIAPLDLIEFLEEQGYEPEAQVTQKGEIALRGGIVDIFPPTSPWPVRLEFFGDELESLRHF
ncbi:MAG TPA: transcription-repair coupling factor, partial [Candidatus Angelobacter sp.]|nr:transcription-repair coupling factor [Candidatus Angelobacter sp.]